MMQHLIEVQDKMATTICKVQQQSSIDCYTTDVKTCTGQLEDFHSWFLSIEKVYKLTGNDPKDICFAKAQGNLLKLLYSHPLHKFSWYSLKEKMSAEFCKVAIASQGNLAFKNCK